MQVLSTCVHPPSFHAHQLEPALTYFGFPPGLAHCVEQLEHALLESSAGFRTLGCPPPPFSQERLEYPLEHLQEWWVVLVRVFYF